MIINPKAEMLPAQFRQKMSLQLLQKNLQWAYSKSAFYREKFMQANITPQAIQSLDDLCKIPLTTVAELQSTAQFDLLTMPLSATMRLDKTANDMYIASTAGDISHSIDIAVRALACNDINKTSLLALVGDYSSQNLLNLHYAAEALGATIIPCKNNSEAINAITTFNANILIITAAALRQIIESDGNLNLPPKIILLTDKLTSEDIDFIESKLNKTLAKIYTSPELGLPAILFTCEQNHWHIQDDYFYPEIVGGKLVLTALTFEAMPIIRLQTQQEINLNANCTCDCGRTFLTANCK